MYVLLLHMLLGFYSWSFALLPTAFYPCFSGRNTGRHLHSVSVHEFHYHFIIGLIKKKFVKWPSSLVWIPPRRDARQFMQIIKFLHAKKEHLIELTSIFRFDIGIFMKNTTVHSNHHVNIGHHSIHGRNSLTTTIQDHKP